MADVADDKVAILVGAEGPGLTETAMRASDIRVRIPMSRGTDSLNVATAAALAFYERARFGAVTDDVRPRGRRADGGGVRRGGDRRRGRGAEHGADPGASAAGRRAQPGGRRRAGADGVGMAHNAGVAVVRAGPASASAGAWLALLALTLG